MLGLSGLLALGRWGIWKLLRLALQLRGVC